MVGEVVEDEGVEEEGSIGFVEMEEVYSGTERHIQLSPLVQVSRE